MFINIDWGKIFIDYSEYFVGIPACVLGLWFAYRWQKGKKSLTYQVLSNYRLITLDSKYRNQFKILFKNEEVENVHLVVIKFKNTGNTPIEKRDFERPIKIILEPGSNVVISELIEQIPENIGIEIISGKDQIEISPCLLNQSDSFSFQFLVSGVKATFSIDGRISGVKKITELQANNNVTTLFFFIYFGFATIPIVWVVAGYFNRIVDNLLFSTLIALALVLISLISVWLFIEKLRPNEKT